MAKRGRKRKHKLKIRTDTAKSVLAIVFVLLGALIAVSFLAPNYTINSVIQNVVRGGFGWAGILLSPALVILGLMNMQSVKVRFVELRVLVGLVGFMIGISSLVQLFVAPETALEVARQGGGGGIIGFYIADFLAGMLSRVGAFLMLSTILLIMCLLIIDTPLDDIVTGVQSRASSIKESSLFAKFSKSGASLNDGEFVVTQGLESEDSDEDTGGSAGSDELLLSDDAVVTEPTFKIVSSMAEPQKNKLAEVPLTASSGILPRSPGLPYSDKVWEKPPLDLLEDPDDEKADRGDVKVNEKKIKDALSSFGIDVEVVDTKFGPTVTQYQLKARSGIRVSQIAGLQNDLALALASSTGTVRVEAPIPGTSHIGIELPNSKSVKVTFKEVFISDKMKFASKQSKLSVVLGKDVGGLPVVYDLKKMPHLLVAGATGSGKSVFLHSLMFSLLYNADPNDVKFILIDPKRVELVYYDGIPHLYSPVVTDLEKAPAVFKWAVAEMERRLGMLQAAGVRNIDAYNEKSGFQAMPYIVIVVDELAEIMVSDASAVEKSIIRIAQLARAVGIHLVLTTQRPSTNIVTGVIKANVPCRIAFNVASNVDSRVIIDQPGAEKLIGKGDMLFVPPDSPKPKRIQGAFISDSEINDLVGYLKATNVEPDYKEEILTAATKDLMSGSSSNGEEDDKYEEAVELVINAKKASASFLQTRLMIGYNRASRIIQAMEDNGIIGPQNGSKPREVLVTKELGGIQDPLTTLNEE